MQQPKWQGESPVAATPEQVDILCAWVSPMKFQHVGGIVNKLAHVLKGSSFGLAEGWGSSLRSRFKTSLSQHGKTPSLQNQNWWKLARHVSERALICRVPFACCWGWMNSWVPEAHRSLSPGWDWHVHIATPAWSEAEIQNTRAQVFVHFEIQGHWQVGSQCQSSSSASILGKPEAMVM